MKKCKICNIEKDESEYYKNKKYLESCCKICSRIKRTCEHNHIKSTCKNVKVVVFVYMINIKVHVKNVVMEVNFVNMIS